MKLEKISKQFSGVSALHKVDFDLREGEVHVLFGENGAGKSTLINIVAGPALSSTAKAALGKFIKDLGTGKAEFFKGPLYYQDGTLFLKDGEVATDKKVWYMKQLLKGMSGQSGAK